ncbi:MAG: aldo/keto reductase [Actinobacteria bacterium]|nr:aldo/keto reductase [Actinomycetota bacterium]
MATYRPDPHRYDGDHFRRCGSSGLQLPLISLGTWQNFGGVNVFEDGRAVIRRAFDRGVTHIDCANMYGPPNGSAEHNIGRILAEDFRTHRDELLISSKAGFGARTVEQLDDSLGALDNLDFSAEELAEIDDLAQDGGIDLWRATSAL